MRVRGSGQRVNIFVQSRPSSTAGTLVLRVGSGQTRKRLPKPSIFEGRVGAGLRSVDQVYLKASVTNINFVGKKNAFLGFFKGLVVDWVGIFYNQKLMRELALHLKLGHYLCENEFLC